MPATTHTEHGDELIHVGAGAGLLLVQLAALIPGLLPIVAITLLVALVLVLPLIALALVGGLLVAVPWSLWRLATAAARAGRARARRAAAHTARRSAAPPRFLPSPRP